MKSEAITHPARLEAVQRSRLVDTEPEIVFDELTSAAARLLKAPFAFMTAVDDERSFWKSTQGIEDGTRANAVEDSFCQYVIELRDELIVGDARTNDMTRSNPSIESMGVRAWAGCPVVLDGEVVGTFCVVDQQARTWTEDDRRVLRNLAKVASREVALRADHRAEATSRAAAVERADELEQLLDTVRASFLPPTPPTIPGVELAAWYEPADDRHLLLGDFYDAFPVDRNRWSIVVGDVCGHGAPAARLTAMIRYTLRSALVHQPDPAAALEELDGAIRRDQLDDGRFATLCVFNLTIDDGGVDVDYARAGHTLPIRLVAGADPQELVDASGPPVGLPTSIASPWTAARLRLGPGEVIVSYTDGAIDCTQSDGTKLGEAALLRTLAAGDDPPRPDRAVGAVRTVVTADDRHIVDDTLVLAFGPSVPREPDRRSPT